MKLSKVGRRRAAISVLFAMSAVPTFVAGASAAVLHGPMWGALGIALAFGLLFFADRLRPRRWPAFLDDKETKMETQENPVLLGDGYFAVKEGESYAAHREDGERFMTFTAEEPVLEWIERIVEDKRRRGVVA